MIARCRCSVPRSETPGQVRRQVGLAQRALGGAVRDEREREAHPRLGLPLRAAAPTGADRLLEVAYGRVGVVELERGHAERAVRRGRRRRVGAVAGAPQRLAGERARRSGSSTTTRYASAASAAGARVRSGGACVRSAATAWRALADAPAHPGGSAG